MEEARQAAERQQQEVNAVANSVAPAPAPQPQAQPAPAATDPRAMANAVQAAITGQQDIPPQSAYEPEQATAAFEPQSNGYADDEDEEAERVRRYAPKGRLFDDEDDEDDGTQMYDTDDLDDDNYDDRKKSKKRGRYADDDESSEDDVMAERIIRLAPPITAIACALIVAVSLVYHFILA